MNKRSAGFAALLALAATPGAAQESAKIGFVGTFSGPAAVIGNDMRDGFELALDHPQGRRPPRPGHLRG